MSQSWRHWSLALVFIVAAPSALADTQLKVKPGKWLVEITAKSPMGTSDQTREVQQCIAETGISAETFVAGSEGCTVSDVEVDGSEMRWKVRCVSRAGKLTGKARLETDGDQMQGRLTLRTVVGGQPVAFEQRWEGRRVGPCE